MATKTRRQEDARRNGKLARRQELGERIAEYRMMKELTRRLKKLRVFVIYFSIKTLKGYL
jgi:chromatin segregation and condensation protein Rec8/ScpA/Scc1 (kleisin family)